jgi:hypothetical protein
MLECDFPGAGGKARLISQRVGAGSEVVAGNFKTGAQPRDGQRW